MRTLLALFFVTLPITTLTTLTFATPEKQMVESKAVTRVSAVQRERSLPRPTATRTPVPATRPTRTVTPDPAFSPTPTPTAGR